MISKYYQSKTRFLIANHWPKLWSLEKARRERDEKGLTQTDVEAHHHHEADDTAPGCQLAVTAAQINKHFAVSNRKCYFVSGYRT